jgi:DNA-binding MarR family transcriptional regulator
MPTNSKRIRSVPLADDSIDQRSGLDLGHLTDSIAYQVRRAHLAVLRDFGQRLAEVDIVPRHIGLLVFVQLNPGAAQGRIAAAIELDRSTIVPIINRLEEGGFLERRASKEDARSNGLWLTRKGARILDQLHALGDARDEAMLDGFSVSERRALLKLIKRLIANLDRS